MPLQILTSRVGTRRAEGNTNTVMIYITAGCILLSIICVALCVRMYIRDQKDKQDYQDQRLKERIFFDEQMTQLHLEHVKVIQDLEHQHEKNIERLKSTIPDHRKDAAKRTKSLYNGKGYERLIPFLCDHNPDDFRHMAGGPIDYIIFEGISKKKIDKIIFAEVKFGTSTMNSIQRKVKAAIDEGKVEFEILKGKNEL